MQGLFTEITKTRQQHSYWSNDQIYNTLLKVSYSHKLRQMKYSIAVVSEKWRVINSRPEHDAVFDLSIIDQSNIYRHENFQEFPILLNRQ